jgi:hypothetical protein
MLGGLTNGHFSVNKGFNFSTGVFQAFLAEAGTRVAIVAEFAIGVSTEHDSTQILSGSFGRSEAANDKLLLQPRFNL